MFSKSVAVFILRNLTITANSLKALLLCTYPPILVHSSYFSSFSQYARYEERLCLSAVKRTIVATPTPETLPHHLTLHRP